MGHTLVWEPAVEPQTINHGYGDRAMQAIEELYGPYPITLGTKDLPVLKALYIACSERPLAELTQLVERHGTIRMWLVDGYFPDRAAITASHPRTLAIPATAD